MIIAAVQSGIAFRTARNRRRCHSGSQLTHYHSAFLIGAKISDQKGVKRPLEEATAEGDKIAAAATQKLASNAAVTDSDLDALLPDEGYETLAKPAAPEKKNAAVTDADLDALLPDEGYEKKDAQPEG